MPALLNDREYGEDLVLNEFRNDLMDPLIRLLDEQESQFSHFAEDTSVLPVLPESSGGQNLKELDVDSAVDKILQLEMLQPVVAILAKKRDDCRLQSELTDLLGFQNLPLLQAIMTNQNEVKKELLSRLGSNKVEKSMVPVGPTFTITTESAKAADKLRKKGKNQNRSFENQQAFLNSIAEQGQRDAFFAKSGDGTVAELLQNVLPVGVQHRNCPEYEEILVPCAPAAAAKPSELVPVTEFDDWAQLAFQNITRLNAVQSKVFDVAFRSNDNMLICAPTGAGKTLIALMAMLHLIGQYIHGGSIRSEEFKIVYVAPMKALAAEMAANFQSRLAPFNIKVNEWTGDIQLTKKQVAETNVYVTTPEKWDAITRKTADDSLANLLRLLIIDEVHLLHESRGSVIETLVARTLRQVESTQAMIRIVGLSATLPNYKDVATFLGVSSKGLFVFDSSFRPVPLSQTFIGVKLKSAAGSQQHSNFGAREAAMNQVLLEKCTQSLAQGHQVMVFVHARKATANTARDLSEMAKLSGKASVFAPPAPEPWVKKDVAKSTNKDLKELFSAGFGCHHAGMLRPDRTLTEKLFKAGYIKVLVCTATLAWGVNLPAHTVIIKGTDIYDVNKGGFVDLGMLDVMQIFGRAGRPQFDNSGEGIIITTHAKLPHYVRLLTHALPIESCFVESLEDHLNAEIVLGTVSDIREAVRWLGYTYLYVRMRRNPMQYGISYDELAGDPLLGGKREQLIRDAAKRLDETRMIRFNEETGLMSHTELGRIASHLYIQWQTIELFNERLNECVTEAQIMSMIAECHEFANIKVRQDEFQELDDLSHNCVIPIGLGGVADNASKINVLLQSSISQARIRNPALVSDVNYIMQNVGRIFRALFETSLQHNWAGNAVTFLKYCISVERQSWYYNHPLRQFNILPDDIIQKLETRRVTMSKLADMDEMEIGKLITNTRYGSLIKHLSNLFPSLRLEVVGQPITRNILRVKLTITPNFEWSDGLHGSMQSFWIFVEDTDAQVLHHFESFSLTKKIAIKKESQTVNFTIPLVEPLPSQYLVRVLSERFFGAEEAVPLSFAHLILPQAHPPYTDLLPLTPLPLSALNSHEFMKLYRFTHFNPIQTQVFHTMFHTDCNVLLGAPTGSGKTIAAELAALRVFSTYPGQKVIYIGPLKALVKERVEDWTKRFSAIGKEVVELTGDSQPDIALLNKAELLCTTPEKWDGISRNWHNRSYVRDVALLIIDEIHLLGNDRGPILEVIVSRMRYIGWSVGKSVRLVGLSTALSNAKDLADWMGIERRGLYNFRPSVRPVPVEVHIAGFPGKHYCPRMATMNKPAYNAIMQHSPLKPVLIFVSSRRQTRLTALDLINYLAADNRERAFVRISDREMEEFLEQVSDPHLQHTLSFGIGLHHAGLGKGDKVVVEKLFGEEKIQVLIATSTLAWGVNFPAHLVIVKGTEFYDGKTKQYVDYPITDVLQMIGRAGRPQFDKEAQAVVLVHEPKKGFYKKFLYDPFPVESSLHTALHEHLNAEIVAGTVAKRQDAVDYLTWTYLFRRIMQNPSYYGIESLSHESITVFLSRLVEQVLRDLQSSRCLEDASCDELVPTTLGRIASYYYMAHQTVALFDGALSPASEMPQLLKLLSEAEEYSELPVRHNEDKMNAELAREVPWPVDTRNLDDPHVKANLLFQAHFSRCRLPISDYLTDTKSVLDNAIRILQAMVDISANNGLLEVSLKAMNLLQMVLQGRWHFDNSLLQLPHLEKRHLPALAARGITCLPEFLWTPPAQQYAAIAELFRGSEDEHLFTVTHEVVDAARRFPRVDVKLGVTVNYPELSEEEMQEGGVCPQVELSIELTRRSRYYPRIFAPRFSKPKDEGWWVVIGDPRRAELVAVKRLNGFKTHTCTKLVLDWDEELYGRGNDPDCGQVAYGFHFYLVSDCYLGLDQEYRFEVPFSAIPPDPAPRERCSVEALNDRDSSLD
eukprot:RCo050792